MNLPCVYKSDKLTKEPLAIAEQSCVFERISDLEEARGHDVYRNTIAVTWLLIKTTKPKHFQIWHWALHSDFSTVNQHRYLDVLTREELCGMEKKYGG